MAIIAFEVLRNDREGEIGVASRDAGEARDERIIPERIKQAVLFICRFSVQAAEQTDPNREADFFR